MQKILVTLGVIALGVAISTSSAIAGSATTSLSSCMADNTTGKERKALARWVFIAMTAHPEMRDLSHTTVEARDQINQAMGTMVNKLLTESCAAQARTALKQEGSVALQTAFGVLGQLAMQELMSNSEVNASISGFEKYVDKKKLDASLSQK